jgi:hypothetical protein
MMKISPDELSHTQSRAIGAHRGVQFRLRGSRRRAALDFGSRHDVGVFDFGAHATDVRFGSKANMAAHPINVRFAPESGHRLAYSIIS